MTLMGKSNPLGGGICAYTPETVLFDGNSGASATLSLKRGLYYVRAQGAGAGGGNCGYSGPVPASTEIFIFPSAKKT